MLKTKRHVGRLPYSDGPVNTTNANPRRLNMYFGTYGRIPGPLLRDRLDCGQPVADVAVHRGRDPCLSYCLATPSVIHANFTLHRRCLAAPYIVFQAFADPREKTRWQSSPDVNAVEANPDDEYLEFDFRVGGHERFAFEHDGVVYEYDAQYFDILPTRRIVYEYTMMADGRPCSISVVTISL
jgi:uncharacterized protein YndB with AHSA1/START domain